MRRIQVWSVAAAAGLAVPLALGSVPAFAATAAKPYDFDGDGQVELVAGAPGLEVNGHPAAGGVAVVPPSDASRGTVFTQSSKKVTGASEEGDGFGSAVASADFDRDGFADLAVGQPGEDLTKASDAGAVTILYGSPQGLQGNRSQQLVRPGGPYEFAGFGTAVAVGDLNGDGYPDLAVGAPADDSTDRFSVDNPASGSVTVFFGSKSGLRTTGTTRVRGVRGTDGQDNQFGSSVAVADVDADGRPDLVVTAQGHIDDDDGGAFAGSVSYCPGATAGPTSCRRLARGRDLQNNHAVVVGNVQGDARPEIVVGVPSSSIISDPGHLEVLVLSGSGSSTSARATSRDQTDLGVAGVDDEEGSDDAFGWSVAIGKVDGDGYADLVVGAPGERAGDDNVEAGRVVLVHGGAGGLATRGNAAFDQDTRGVPGGSEEGDAFGGSVTLLDRNGDGTPDLTIGSPGEDDDGGRVTTLLGTGSGFTAPGAESEGLADLRIDQRFQARFGESVGQ